MDQPRVHPNAPGPAVNLQMGGGGVYPPGPPPPAHDGQSVNRQQLGGSGAAANSWVGNDANTLLVVATLITTLTYQLGSNIPGGYWQDTQPAGPGNKGHTTGDPVMRDLHAERYTRRQRLLSFLVILAQPRRLPAGD